MTFVWLLFCFAVLAPLTIRAENSIGPIPEVDRVSPCSYSDDSSGGTLWQNIEACRQCGYCELNDFVIIAINISQWILGIVGSLALLFFIYGGITMIISAGSSEKVQEGKTILQNAIIGLVIVFVSWTVINFVYNAFVRTEGTPARSWYKLP